jgi:ATP-binding cassette subfamily B protein
MEKLKLPANGVTHRQVLKFLWRYLHKRKLLLVTMVMLLVTSTVIGLIQPFFYKEAVDTVARSMPGRGEAIYASLMVAIGVFFGLLHISLNEWSYWMLGWLESSVMREAHADVFSHVQRLSTHFHVSAFAGATSRKIGRGVDALENLMDIIWFNFAPLAVAVVGFTVILSVFAPLIGVAIITAILVYAPVSVSLNILAMRRRRAFDHQDTRLTASIVDTITGNAAVKAFGAEVREDERHGSVLAEWRSRLWRTWRFGTAVGWAQSSMLVLIELTLLLLAVYLWYRGEFTAGSFIVVTFYVGRLWGYLRDIGNQVRNYLQSLSRAEEMVGLWQTPVSVADRGWAKDLTVSSGAITFDRVSFKYGKQARYIFENFSVAIRPGEKVALVGHSGGGKTTFVSLLLRLYDVAGGMITIDGQDVRDVTQESLRRSIALVPQDPVLFHRSIAENIAYGCPGATQAEIERASKLAHAHEFIQSFPEKYSTLVGERGVKLSGGERQRVAIARAILADTPILILDEATSSLDSISEKYIQHALVFLMRGRTTIVIAHRLSTIKRVDRILVIEGGKIREEGTHAELVKKEGGTYRGFFELQAGGFIGE